MKQTEDIPDKERGLTSAQVQARIAQGRINEQNLPKSKRIGQIIRDNTLTLFNFLNFALAFVVILSGHYRNLLFIGVILCNIVIGIVQEIRAKRMVDKLSLISAPHAVVLRDAAEHTIKVDEVVLDDIMLLNIGKQICADAVVVSGEAEVNESLLTGEADPILKKPGDNLLSGSFVVSGKCKARVIHVGGENYAAKLTADAKKHKKLHSELMSALNKIIKIISIFIVPVGLLLFFTQYRGGAQSVDLVLVNTVAALVGMIPEGLILLTSVALAVGVVRLGKKKTLVQELYCIETLARVDVLCLDKTGTITEGNMEVTEVVSLTETAEYDIAEAMGALVHSLEDDNATFLALKEYFTARPSWVCTQKFPFSSARKWSGAVFKNKGCFLIGAPEFILKQRYDIIRSKVEQYSSQGMRVLLLAHTPEQVGALLSTEDSGSENLVCVALLVLSDRIRPQARETLRFFAEQDVALKVISGDNPVTVSMVAKRAGLSGAENDIDASTLQNAEDLAQAAGRYTVFGRVSPQQKRQLIQALKEQGHTVAMTGDGVNDVLALKAADCSIAMAAGSEAARNIAQLVLMNSDFSSMPGVVMEGRRVINNIQRAASLFLVKTIFSFLLAVIMIFIGAPYPFLPIHLTLLGGLTIGIPSFFLALESNKKRVRGNFIRNVLSRALPGALTVVTNILVLLFFSRNMLYSREQISTIAVIVTGVVGFLVLLQVCLPFNWKRAVLFGVLCAAFAFSVLFLGNIFVLTPISGSMLMLLISLALAAYPLIRAYTFLFLRFARNSDIVS